MTRIVSNGAHRMRRACWRQARAEVLAAHVGQRRAPGLVSRFLRMLRLRPLICARARELECSTGPKTLF